MKLTEIARTTDGGCQGGNCPAVYTTDDAAFLVVQGKVLDQATTHELTGIAADEIALSIPRELLLEAAARLEHRS